MISFFFFLENLQAQPLLLRGEEKAQWNFTLEKDEMTFTGLCIVKQVDGVLLGSVFNEFGVHAFDLKTKGKKTKVFNVMSMMNKWYVRKILRKDLNILTTDENINIGGNYDLVTTDTTLVLKNKRRNITYEFEILKSDDTP